MLVRNTVAIGCVMLALAPVVNPAHSAPPPSAPLPLAEVHASPLVLAAEKQVKWSTWPARDNPSLGAPLLPERPGALVLAVGPKAYFVSPRADVVPELAPFSRAAEPLSALSADPTARAARELLLVPQYSAGVYSPPLVLVTVPSLDSHLRGLPAVSLPDAEPPAASLAPPHVALPSASASNAPK